MLNFHINMILDVSCRLKSVRDRNLASFSSVKCYKKKIQGTKIIAHPPPPKEICLLRAYTIYIICKIITPLGYYPKGVIILEKTIWTLVMSASS